MKGWTPKELRVCNLILGHEAKSCMTVILFQDGELSKYMMIYFEFWALMILRAFLFLYLTNFNKRRIRKWQFLQAQVLQSLHQ